MTIPIQIDYLNIGQSPALESTIRERAKKLEKFADRILSCRVTVGMPHEHHSKGKAYHVMVDVHLPGTEILANRDTNNHEHDDLNIAIRDAFNAAHRQLIDHAHTHRWPDIEA
jgi:ribosomal subunit interface protein